MFIYKKNSIQNLQKIYGKMHYYNIPNINISYDMLHMQFFQILLLYNWHSNLGEKWESNKEKQFFFTEWEMIHNIFSENCVFDGHEILNMFPNASDKQKAAMFEHIKP